jgi:hypothetical protein
MFMLAGGIVVAIFSWSDNKPDAGVWTMRIISAAALIGGVAGGLFLLFRRDRAPDFLQQTCGGYFDRGGFCFAIVPTIVDNRCYLRVYFQNRFERPCRGRVALKPRSGFFSRPDIQGLTFDIECPAAGFGFYALPFPIPRQYQGTRQKFEVGASVEYPAGKGRMLRFRAAMVLRSNASFGNPFHTTLTVMGALAGSLVISRPATITWTLPSNVKEDVLENDIGHSCLLWQLGDGPEVSPRPLTTIEYTTAPPDPNNPYAP